MEELGFRRYVLPPGPPFEKNPIPTIGWRRDPALQKLAEDVAAAAGDSKKLEELLEVQAALRRPMPLAEYVDKALAVTVEQRDYSYGQLVRAIAQQLGGSHEDNAVDESLAVMTQSVLGKLQGHLAPLVKFAELVLGIGMEFLAYLSKSHGFELRHFERSGETVRPPAIDIERLRDVPEDQPVDATVGSDLTQEGTIFAQLRHDHRDWTTNSNGYDFGTISTGGASLRAVKEPTGILRLRLLSPSGSFAVIDHPLDDLAEDTVSVAASWNEDRARFYVGGVFIGDVELSASSIAPAATANT
jgi:hypothetical protein